MSTSAVDATSASAAATQAPSVAPKTSLGKDDFLKLLTAQLANQDPLNPVDNQAFVAQLAQFSSLEQLQSVNSNLETLLVAAASQNQMGTASLVGKDVSYNAQALAVGADGSAPKAQVHLAARAAVTAVIQDSSGRTVRTLALGVHDAGDFDLGWDGRDDAGNALPAGSYSIAVSALAGDGSKVDVQTRATGVVQSVSFDSGAAELIVNGVHVKMSDVNQISQS